MQLIKKLVLVCLSAMCIGAAYYIYLNDIVLIWRPQTALFVRQTSLTQTRITTTNYLKNGEWRTDSVDVMWDDQQPRIAHLVQQLLHTMHDENVVPRKVMVEFAQTNPAGSTVFIQFDRSPLHKHGSIADNIAIIDSILKTIHSHVTGVSAISFLVHHEPLHDAHLLFSQPWPIQSYLIRS